MNKQMQEVIDQFTELNPLPIEKQSPENARQLPELRDAVMGVVQKHMAKRLIKGVVIPIKEIKHILVPNGEEGIVARIYNPSGERDLPVLLYFHGGGFVIASINSYDASCRALAQAAQCIVVSIAYRQAPEHSYPAAHNDAFASYEWLIRNCEAFGGDPTRIAIGGESAGGNLAASVCIRAKQKGLPLPVHQLLVYPVVDCDMNRLSYTENANAKPLNKSMMNWFFKHYFGSNIPINDPIAFPIKAENLEGLPSATIITAEIDPLCSEGEAYGEKLKTVGVPVYMKRYDGVTHEFFGMGAVVDDAMAAVKEVADQLQAAFELAEDTANRPDTYIEEVHPII